ncbi:MAG: ATP-binding protein [Verrucomicrobiota bacterium]
MEQPAGTVTFLFTDIEGSTRLLEELGPEAYREALGEHRRVLRDVFARHCGYEVDYEGDAFFIAFQEAPAGVEAAREAQAALGDGPIRVRMALHTGEPILDPPKYVGIDVHLASRIMSAGHGGQVLLSRATRDLVDGEVRDLGEHRVKDFDEPVWIFQLGDGSFPPLKTISNTNLPRPASTFVGREQEVGAVVSLVREGARLVTLTGPGGSGKTRLAIEAAAELVPDFKGGAFWVGLATLRDPSLVLPTVAQVLGAGDDLSAHVGERELILLLDNLEQVVEAAPDLAGLVEASPNLRLLVTSRERLRVRGEVEYEVLPLDDSDAVELFCLRSGLTASDAIAELCRRLDDMPLAVELAAARTKALAPEQILERLSQRLDLFTGGRDADPRQQTLRATIEWSYDLLTDDEQMLFARLGVFAGGCTLEAAEQVAGADLDTLQSLVEKSLLRHSAERFWMLETIRELAAERYAELEDAEQLERRYRGFYLELARAAEVGERGPDQAVWWGRLEAELDNLRASIDLARVRGDHREELELAVLLKRFWHVRSRLQEGRRRIEQALDAAGGADGVLRARALAALTYCIGMTQGDAASARPLTEEALRFYSERGDTGGVARMTLDLGVIADVSGDLQRARSLYERAQLLAYDAGDRRYQYFAAHNLANSAFRRAEYPLAIELGEQCVAAARATEDPGNMHSGTLLLAYILAGAGRTAESRKLGLWVFRETVGTGLQWVARDALELLVITDVAGRNPERGARLAGLAERLRAETAEPRDPSGGRLYDPAFAEAERLLGTEAFRQALAEGAKLGLQEAVALASAPPTGAP